MMIYQLLTAYVAAVEMPVQVNWREQCVKVCHYPSVCPSRDLYLLCKTNASALFPIAVLTTNTKRYEM